MDDSDDIYFGGDDDITFDEKTLAIIDQTEKKWQAELESKKTEQEQASQLSVCPQPIQQTRHSSPFAGQRRPSPQDAPLPPPKKQKTSHIPTPGPCRTAINDDYDDDLPDVSIIGDGSYKFPAAQRETANELAAQIHGPPATTNHAGPSSRHNPRAPARAPITSRTLAPTASSAPAPSYVSKPGHNTNTPTPAAVPGPSPQGPPASARSQQARQATFLAIQAALAGVVPPAASQRNTASPVYNARANRATPAPPHRGPSLVSRPPVPGASGATRNISPTVPPAANRGQSSNGPSRQRVEPQLSVPQQPPSRQQLSQQQQHLPPPSQDRNDRASQIELDSLRARINELEKAQQEAKVVLEQAQNARYAKEGEVSILRKNIEKTAKDHAAEMSRLKVAKEQVEAQQVEMRKQMTEEFERMKTSFQFKQLELETSTRKSPWAVRLRHADGTPTSEASHRRQTSEANASPYQTPSRSRNFKDVPGSPPTRRQKRNFSVPESPPRKSAKLRGFVNAFEDSPPKRSVRFVASQSSQLLNGKGKGNEKVPREYSEPEREELFFNPPEDAHQPFLQPSSSPEIPDAVPIPDSEPEEGLEPSSSADLPVESASEDVEMKDNDRQAEPLEPLQEPDWIKELHRILFTHKHRVDNRLTLQLLMNFVFPASASTELSQPYNARLSSMLEVMSAAVVKVVNPEQTIRDIGETLCGIGHILCVTSSVQQLTALIDMLKVIALFVPVFIPLVMATSGAAGGVDALPEILLLLCETVRDMLVPTEDGLDDFQVGLATETLGLLEAVAWHTPPELAMRLTAFIRKEGVLSVLVNNDQPAWVLHRGVRALALMASHHSIHKHFLLYPLSDSQEQASEKDYSAIPHIERMSALLLDPARAGNGCHDMKDSILHFITTLAVANRDSLNILLKSNTLLPSIIVFLTDISGPLWEEHEEFVAEPELVAWTVRTLVRIVLLLWHLFNGADHTAINLRHKLMVPKRNSFNGLWHMFTVALGRLSYAPPPEISMDNQIKLEQIADLAKDVLEMAVDGPELESIWAAFHVEGADAAPKTHLPVEEGDEEDEASMLHSDIE